MGYRGSLGNNRQVVSLPKTSSGLEGSRKKVGEIVEIMQNQKDGRPIAPSRSPLKYLSVYGEK
jgi:hypothetical protein